jgi:hypothetical protein
MSAERACSPAPDVDEGGQCRRAKTMGVYREAKQFHRIVGGRGSDGNWRRDGRKCVMHGKSYRN